MSHHEPTNVPLIRPRHLIWVLVVGVMGFVWLTYGTPHLRFAYSYTGSASAPFMQSCDYVGWDSRQVISLDGKCPLIKFLKERRS